MGKGEQIRQALKRMAAEAGPDSSLLAQVKSVDEDELMCELYDEESELTFYDVRLRPVLDGKKCLTIIPKVDSWVLAIRLEDSEDWIVVSVGEAEKFQVTATEIVLNEGENGGLVKWPEAKEQLDKVIQFINVVKQAASTPVAEPGNGAPSAFQAALNAAISTLQVPSFEDLENEDVKH